MREKLKYAVPIPSRELILQILDDCGRPISRQDLFERLVINEKEQEAVGYRLKAMLNDGQIMQDRRGRYCLVGKINLVRGQVQGHPDGFGFFIPDDGSDDMVLSPKEMRAIMHGDHVLAYQSGIDKRGRPEAKIREIIEHANMTIVGRFFSEYGVGFVIPDNKRLTQDISIPLEFAGSAINGQIVLAELIAFPSKRNQAIGKIIQILGEHMAPGMETTVAIHAHGIPADWPADVLDEISAIPLLVDQKHLENRVDLRHLPFITIDGEDAQDFDDAVYCEPKTKNGWRLFVAIADVGHYVLPGSAIDLEAAKRGNSVYFPGKVVPMLPEKLSNGICSLVPLVDRLCVVAEMSINSLGKVVRTNFYRAVFHSQARLTYNKAASMLEDQSISEEYSHIWHNLQALHSVYKILFAARKLRGALEFDSVETQIEFDDKRKIKRVVPVLRNEAHRIIEECMLVANVAVARFLQKSKIATLYRVHHAPDTEKINTLRKFLNEFGLQLGGGKKPHPEDFQKTLVILAERSEKHLIETVMLRSLKQAKYIEDNVGHFGLAYPVYTHFTSPIRRYPDLLIHRALVHLLLTNPSDTFEYNLDDMNRFGKYCSMTERRADEAVREVISWLKCEYMQDKLGQVFRGTISTVTGFGIFVELNEIYVEGLVHVTSLRNDYYSFDQLRHRLIGERSHQIYSLGDQVMVMVARVDLDERKIDFELADNQ
ncbi:MAG: ribonuclease R [Legionellales bacterium RIFCSPHIGHO2_12_FULL_42_9]|nr:MAG: ribonuclease R [Legionellales bacterium RIFCSPHIGHO2_12_FULL_42_9]